MKTPLTPHELERYQRHLQLPGFGVEQQLRLKQVRVLLIGAGGLGCPIGLYLAAAGVGTLGIVDDDTVSLHNLQRQIAYQTIHIGKSKASKLAEMLKALNPEIESIAYPTRLQPDNIEALFSGYDVIIDGTDTFESRFLIADACYLLKKPLVHGAVYQFGGQVSVFEQSPCYRCLFQAPSASQNCSEAGVLGVLPGTIGLIMATETLKYITGIGEPLTGQVLFYDALTQEMKKIKLLPDPQCPLCGETPNITTFDTGKENLEVSIQEAQNMLEQGAQLLDVREPFEYAMGNILNAPLIPLGLLSEDTVPAADTLIVYCRSGKRSLEATQKLRAWGHPNVFSMAGGIEAWLKESAPSQHTAV